MIVKSLIVKKRSFDHVLVIKYIIFRQLVLQLVVDLAQAMPAFSLATRTAYLRILKLPFSCLIKRHIDDIVGATSLPLADLQQFINYTNNFHPALKFRHPVLLQKKACHFGHPPYHLWQQNLHTHLLQMLIASLTMIHCILRNARTLYPSLNSAISTIFVQIMKISF